MLYILLHYGIHEISTFMTTLLLVIKFMKNCLWAFLCCIMLFFFVTDMFLLSLLLLQHTSIFMQLNEKFGNMYEFWFFTSVVFFLIYNCVIYSTMAFIIPWNNNNSIISLNELFYPTKQLIILHWQQISVINFYYQINDDKNYNKLNKNNNKLW